MARQQKMQAWGLVGFVMLLILIDQAIKFYVKLNFQLGEVRPLLGSWFSLCFVENNGMAFGIEWFDKLFLTIFRVVAVIVLVYYAVRLIKQNTRTSYLLTIGMVIAGAMGNIIDCMFYGLIFSDSYGHVAQLVPFGTGYESFMYGRVVDMFSLSFFPPIFNFADSCITVSVFLIILFFRNELNSTLESKDNQSDKEEQTIENQ